MGKSFFFQYFLIRMEELDKIVEESKSGSGGFSKAKQGDSNILEGLSKNPKRSNRGSGRNKAISRNLSNIYLDKNFQGRYMSSNTCKREALLQIMQICLKSCPGSRTSDELDSTAKILIDNKLFSEFSNNHQVLKAVAQSATIHLYEKGAEIYSQGAHCDNIFKILEGAVQIYVNLRKSLQNDYNTIQTNKFITEKGQFIENVEHFSQIKKHSAKALQKTYLLKFSYQVYCRGLAMCQESRRIKKSLHATSVFQFFTLKQVESLLQKCQDEKLYHRQLLFKQGNSIASHIDNKKEGLTESYSGTNIANIQQKLMFFIIEGQISITKNWKNKAHQICVIGEGNFVGDEAIFLQQINRRPYTATICSLNARVMSFTSKDIQDWIKSKALGITFEYFIARLKKGVKEKLQHYDSFLQQSQMIKSSIFASVASKSLVPSKRQKLKNISNIVGQISEQVEGMQKIKMKRLNFKSVSEEVSFEQPLFTRKDFPTIGAYLKRFENEEKRALEQFKKGRSLYMS